MSQENEARESDGSFIIRKRDRTISIPPTEKSPSKKYAVPNPSNTSSQGTTEEPKLPTVVRVLENKKVPILSSIEVDEISEFFKQYFEYKSQGGQQHPTEFMDIGVKNYVIRMNFISKPADDELANYIYEISAGQTKSVNEVRARMTKVRMDLTRPTPQGKIDSLFISMEIAIEDLKLQNVSNQNGKIGISTADHIDLLMEKLPNKLRKSMQDRMRYVVGSKSDIRIFRNELVKEAESYNWKAKAG